VYGVATSFEPIMKLLRSTDKFKIRAQLSKMNVGTIAEFLRMDFNAKKPTAKQYLTRACSTFVHSRIESGNPQSQRSLYDSYITRCEEVEARGGSGFARKMLKQQLAFANRLFATPDYSKEYCTWDIVAGGRTTTGYVEHASLVDVNTTSISEPDMKMLSPGIHDFVQYVCNKMPTMRGKASVNYLKDVLASAYNITRNRLTVVESSKQELQLDMSLRGIWASNIKIGAFAKARMTSADLLTTLATTNPNHAEILSRSSNPYRKIAIML